MTGSAISHRTAGVPAIQREQRGFTLLELMIVVTVVGILAAIAIPNYQGYVMRAKVSEGFALASGAKTAVAQAFLIEGDFPANNSQAGLSPPEQMGGRYVGSVAVQAGGAIRATYSDPAIAGESITLTPSGDRSVRWTCTSTLPENYLPASCRGGASLPPDDENDDSDDDAPDPDQGPPGQGNGPPGRGQGRGQGQGRGRGNN